MVEISEEENDLDIDQTSNQKVEKISDLADYAMKKLVTPAALGGAGAGISSIQLKRWGGASWESASWEGAFLIMGLFLLFLSGVLCALTGRIISHRVAYISGTRSKTPFITFVLQSLFIIPFGIMFITAAFFALSKFM